MWGLRVREKITPRMLVVDFLRLILLVVSRVQGNISAVYVLPAQHIALFPTNPQVRCKRKHFWVEGLEFRG